MENRFHPVIVWAHEPSLSTIMKQMPRTRCRRGPPALGFVPNKRFRNGVMVHKDDFVRTAACVWVHADEVHLPFILYRRMLACRCEQQTRSVWASMYMHRAASTHRSSFESHLGTEPSSILNITCRKEQPLQKQHNKTALAPLQKPP